MKLVDLLNRLNIKINERVNLEILNITCDSRKCNKNTLYINMNNQYLSDAINNGIKVIISDKYIDFDGITIYVKDVKSFYYKALKLFYKDLNSYVIGITGTCGKTTTATLLYETLKYKYNNLLLISSNGNYVFQSRKEEYLDTVNTTPNIEIIYDLISKYDYDYIIIEVSSQGLMDNRLEGIVFDLAVFLNISCDHLDYHKTMNEYFNAKLKLFKQLKKDSIALVNYNLDHKDEIKKIVNNLYTFGIDEGDYKISYLEPSLEKMSIKLKDKWFITSLSGDFNAENISAVNAIVKILNVSNVYLELALTNNFKVPGRQNIINYLDSKIIIDFAHTEKEVERLLIHLRNNCKNKLYIIIGCGGDRDKSKRPIIGKLCEKYGDFCIFTKDNSRSENTIDIINQMLTYYNKSNYIVVVNRKDAIKLGISMLKEEDILAVIGMGKEDLKLINEVITNEL